MKEDVLKLAMTLGKTEESDRLRTLCELAVAELTGLLRPGVTAEDCGGAFVPAAAWLALAYQAEGEEDSVASFTAGEVSIRKQGVGERVNALRRQAEAILRPYLRDEGFHFGSVRYG